MLNNEPVAVFGYPTSEQMQLTLSPGKWTGWRRDSFPNIKYPVKDLHDLTAFTSLGNSGGPTYTLDGRILGMSKSVFVRDGQTTSQIIPIWRILKALKEASA